MADKHFYRRWSLKSGTPLDISARQALEYFRGKYGAVIDAIVLSKFDQNQYADCKEIEGLPVSFDGHTPRGCLDCRLKEGKSS